ncbi:MAG: sigma 54-interacting transcriptional regulator [Eubacterium sp.]|nr:sigma 54-interacting transcriptional regulator [Eubacterium sp.]
MQNKTEITISYDRGIHTRVAAMIVQKASELEERFGCRIYIKRIDQALLVPCSSVIPLVGMKLKQGEQVELLSNGVQGARAIMELGAFMEGRGAVDLDAVDNIIQKNTLTSETIFESIENGLVVVDAQGDIIIFNEAAAQMTGLAKDQAIGAQADALMPQLNLASTLAHGTERRGIKEKINDNWVILDKTPVLVEGKNAGAVAVLQDISQIEALSWELSSVKELEGKLISILEAVYDGICLVNEDNRITYANAAFAAIVKKPISQLTEQPLAIVFDGEKIPGTLFETGGETMLTNPDGREFMLDVRPISVDGSSRGSAIVARELTEITKLAAAVEELSAKTDYLQNELAKRQDLDASFETIIGKSGILMEALSVASKAAKTDATVLIRGESGTGKELVARAIHNAGSRKNKPFVGVNCAAIPADLLEAELFGYEKGAFTGAVRTKPGKFELADGGTVFLDEIGDMDKAMQAKLLRVLQEKEVERVGGLGPIKIDVRVIAATNAPLEKLMKTQDFRQDLYYRLNVISVILPPLKQRKGDLPLLIEAFVDKICMRYQLPKKRVSKAALQCLERYDFPGNVRELENIIEGAITLSADEWIGPWDLPAYVDKDGENVPDPRGSSLNIGDKIPTFEEMERELIARALEKYKSFRKAGEALKLDHKTVSAKAKKYGLRQ